MKKTMMKAMWKIANCKTFLPYCALGYWFYSFQCMYENLRENLQYCMDDGSVPDSINLGR